VTLDTNTGTVFLTALAPHAALPQQRSEPSFNNAQVWPWAAATDDAANGLPLVAAPSAESEQQRNPP
jgi:hypothetical protein